MNNKVVRATNKVLFEKLPNILMLNLKRFIWTDRLVKKKEHVYFDEVLEIQDLSEYSRIIPIKNSFPARSMAKRLKLSKNPNMILL
jgi:hypothetical protein